jgi:hypothetical protein
MHGILYLTADHCPDGWNTLIAGCFDGILYLTADCPDGWNTLSNSLLSSDRWNNLITADRPTDGILYLTTDRPIAGIL